MDAKFLSYFLNQNTPAYGGDKGSVNIEIIRSINNGDNSNNLKISFPCHIGTHIDFPFHFSNQGKKLEDYSPSFWAFNKIGFIETSINEVPTAIKKIPKDIEILILKTGEGVSRYEDKYWAAQPIIPSGFAHLFRINFPKLRVFGFDLISLTSKLDREEGKKAHTEFLIENDILILEDMNLGDLTVPPKLIIISPLLLEGADGVPCTVLAIF